MLCVCRALLWGRASAAGTSATAAELPGAPLSKRHWCHRALCGVQPQHRQLRAVSAFLPSVHSVAACPCALLQVSPKDAICEQMRSGWQRAGDKRHFSTKSAQTDQS